MRSKRISGEAGGGVLKTWSQADAARQKGQNEIKKDFR
jgi:hypothetical protein